MGRSSVLAGFATDYPAQRVQAAELTFMRLRHTAVTRLAESGCELGEIAAITGHSLTSVAIIRERYMVRTAALARSAFTRRLAAEQGAARLTWSK